MAKVLAVAVKSTCTLHGVSKAALKKEQAAKVASISSEKLFKQKPSKNPWYLGTMRGPFFRMKAGEPVAFRKEDRPFLGGKTVVWTLVTSKSKYRYRVAEDVGGPNLRELVKPDRQPGSKTEVRSTKNDKGLERKVNAVALRCEKLMQSRGLGDLM